MSSSGVIITGSSVACAYTFGELPAHSCKRFALLLATTAKAGLQRWDLLFAMSGHEDTVRDGAIVGEEISEEYLKFVSTKLLNLVRRELQLLKRDRT